MNTPGPWTANGTQVRASNNSPIATVATRYGDNTGPDEHEANARLIAAAPAMYEALSENLTLLEASYHDMVDKHGPDSIHANTVFKAVERTREVLAQVDGKGEA